MNQPALSSQCTARAKATGVQCRRMVVGGGVCVKHGGGAPQVRAAREARILAARAARVYGPYVEERSPAEALMAAGRSLDFGLQALERLAADGGVVDPAVFREMRAAATESGRMAKLIQDAGLDERRLHLAERDQVALGQALELALAAWGLNPGALAVRESVAEALERVRSGDVSALVSRVPSAPVLELVAKPEGGA